MIKFHIQLRIQMFKHCVIKCPYSELLWLIFPHFPAFSPNAGKRGENTDQNNSEYRHFSHKEDDS